jgi:hypothetical protein
MNGTGYHHVSKIAKLKKEKKEKTNTACFCSYVESRPKMMVVVMMIMRFEYKKGTIWGEPMKGRKGKGVTGDEEIEVCYINIFI